MAHFFFETFGRKQQHYFFLKVPLMYLFEMSHAFSLSNLKIKFKKWLSRILSVWYFYIPTCTKHSQQSSPSIHPSIIHPHTGLRKGARRPSGSPGARSPSRSSPVGSAENMSPSPRGPRVLPPEHEVPIRGVVGGATAWEGTGSCYVIPQKYPYKLYRPALLEVFFGSNSVYNWMDYCIYSIELWFTQSIPVLPSLSVSSDPYMFIWSSF